MNLEQAIDSAAPWTLRYLTLAFAGRWSCTLAREGYYLRSAIGETHIAAVLTAIGDPEIEIIYSLTPSEQTIVKSVLTNLLNRQPAQPRINRRI